jgi:hypothetical protein
MSVECDWGRWFGTLFNPIGLNSAGFEIFFVDDDVEPHSIPPISLVDYIKKTQKDVELNQWVSLYEVNTFRIGSSESLRYRFVQHMIPECWAGYMMISIVPKREHRDSFLSEFFGNAAKMYNNNNNICRPGAMEIFNMQYEYIQSFLENARHSTINTILRWERMLTSIDDESYDIPPWMACLMNPVYNDPVDGKLKFHIDAIKQPEKYIDPTLTLWCRSSGFPNSARFEFYRIPSNSVDCSILVPGLESWWKVLCKCVLVVSPNREFRAEIARSSLRAEGYFLDVSGAFHAYCMYVRTLRKQCASVISKYRTAYNFLFDGSS